MPTICYDRHADEQQQMSRRIEQARTHATNNFDFTLDEDGLGVRVYAASPSILGQVHHSAFSTFEFPGIEKVGPRYMTRFRLR